MSGDLSARLDAALRRQEQHEEGTRPDAATLADLHARVARARRGRAVSYAAVAAAAAGVLGVAGWFGLHRAPAPQPAHTPTPTSTATPSPTPSPSGDAAPTADPPAPLVPVSLPGLPPMYEAPEGILDRTGPGWFVVAYAAPSAADGDDATTLALSAPTGELYHLVDVDAGLHLSRWSDAGVLRAVRRGDDGPSRVVTVDLLTGRVAADDRVPPEASWVGASGDDEVWMTTSDESTTLHVVPPTGRAREVAVGSSGQGAWLSPDGRRSVAAPGFGPAVRVVDLATGAGVDLDVPAGQTCSVAGWLDADGLLATCADPVPPSGEGERDVQYLDHRRGQVVRLDAAGGAPQPLQQLTGDGVAPWIGHPLATGGLVATSLPLLSGSGACFDVCYDGAYVWEGASVSPLAADVGADQEICSVEPGGDGVMLRTNGLCYEAAGGFTWWTVDPATGATRLVARAVEGAPDPGVRGLVERAAP